MIEILRRPCDRSTETRRNDSGLYLQVEKTRIEETRCYCEDPWGWQYNDEIVHNIEYKYTSNAGSDAERDHYQYTQTAEVGARKIMVLDMAE